MYETLIEKAAAARENSFCKYYGRHDGEYV